MAVSLPTSGRVLALDIGDARIGLASASVIARIPQPIETIKNDENTDDMLRSIVEREDARLLVIGVPRNLEGQETAQSQKIKNHSDRLAVALNQEIVYVDESLSSKRADEMLGHYKGADQDSLAACFILQEFFDTL